MVHHMTDAVSKQQFLAADKTCSCETTTSTVLRIRRATSDEPFTSRLSRQETMFLDFSRSWPRRCLDIHACSYFIDHILRGQEPNAE